MGRLRPRRSVLFMPATNARALEKARGLPADCIVFDLEDAVAPDRKPEARERAERAARSASYGARELIVRVNSLDGPWGREDLEAIAPAGVDAVMLPKVERAETTREVVEVLRRAGAADDLPLWCMIETPLGVLHAEEIAASHPSVEALVLGTSDLAKELHVRAEAGRGPLIPSLAHCLLVGRAYGLTVIDGVHLDLEDAAGFAAACAEGAAMGFDGKSLIHPKTIAAANAAYAPSAEDLRRAQQVISAHERAVAEGHGVVVVEGKLVENLHVDDARRLVALHGAIEAREQEADR